MQRARLLGRLEPPLLVERTAGRLVRVERLLLPPGAVQREHEEAAEPFAVGVLRGEPGRVGDRVVVAAELDLRLDPVLERGQPELVEAGDLALEERLEREVGERGPAPERERVAQGCGALGRRQGPRVVHQALEPAGVDRAGVDAQQVAGRAGLDHFLAERVPEPRDGVLHDRVGRRRRVRAPEVVDQRVHRDDRPRVQQEVGEHRALSRATKRRTRTRRARLEWSEQEELHRLAPLCRQRRGTYHPVLPVTRPRLANRWRDTTACAYRRRGRVRR